MDCEKFESTLIDELYDELDELTSAAAKRHVAGCARCASLLSGLKATRRVAVLPMLEPPADLEDRILSAARDAQRVVPMKRRVSNAVSWAGSWAMRPQTAMAAVFLLMIGSSALLLRGRAAKAPASANVTVSAEGSPAPSAMTATLARPNADLEAEESAHGTPSQAAAPQAAAATPLTLAPAATSTAAASGFVAKRDAPLDSLLKGGASSDDSNSLRRAASGKDSTYANPAYAQNDETASNAGSIGGAPAAPKAAAPAAPPPAPVAPPPQVQAQAQGAGQAATRQDADQKKAAASDFESGMTQYRAGNYSESARLFDNAAASGDLVAALYAARSVENQAGCSAAVGRYDQLGTRSFGTTAGYDAALAAGRCYRLLGDYTRARNFLNRLLTVTTHARRAQTELDMMAPAAMAKPAARSAPAAAPPAKASPPPAGQAF